MYLNIIPQIYKQFSVCIEFAQTNTIMYEQTKKMESSREKNPKDTRFFPVTTERHSKLNLCWIV